MEEDLRNELRALHKRGCSAVYRRGTVKGSYQRPGAASRRTIQVCLKGRGDVCRCNPWSGCMEPEDLVCDYNTGYMKGNVFLEEDEMVILRMSGAAHKVSGRMQDEMKRKSFGRLSQEFFREASFRYDIAGLVKEGSNTLAIEVATTLERAVPTVTRVPGAVIPPPANHCGITGEVRLYIL